MAPCTNVDTRLVIGPYTVTSDDGSGPIRVGAHKNRQDDSVGQSTTGGGLMFVAKWLGGRPEAATHVAVNEVGKVPQTLGFCRV